MFDKKIYDKEYTKTHHSNSEKQVLILLIQKSTQKKMKQVTKFV